ncbi:MULTISPECIES: MFS transporter [unclassified Streptomyces]|uniref:MFS transporter n=1 Tax=unclassified Streptomyces TaxID=2593676 RepID=UPI0009A0DDEC|nr:MULTISPECIES: MFS transporter [unclassified Streptomyces]
MASVGLCVTLVFGLGAGVNLAVGRLATGALHPTATQVLWIVDTYLVVFGCLLIPSGAVGDRFGRKGALLTGLAVMAAGSVASAAAPTVPVLLAARAVTGAGAALVLPNSLPLMLSCYPEERRGHAVAVWTALSGGGGVLGNIAGGAVLQFADWQALFAVAAPLAAAGLLLVAVSVPRAERLPRPLDPGAVALLVLAVFGVLFGIIEGPELGWASAPVLVAFGCGAALLALFAVYELRRKHPLLDPRAFRAPGLRAGTLGIVASFVAMYAVFYLNGQYLMDVKGYPPVLAGLGTAPLAVVIFAVSPRSVRLAERHGTWRVVAAGLLVVVAGLGLFSLCGPDTPYALYAVCIVVVGVGSGLSNPPLSQAIVASLPAAQAGVGSGVNSFSREIGGSLGFALFGTLLGSGFSGALPEGLREQQGAAGGRALGALLDGVHRTGGAAADRLAEQVRVAFTTGMSEALRLVGLLLLLVSALVVGWLRFGGSRHGRQEKR